MNKILLPRQWQDNALLLKTVRYMKLISLLLFAFSLHVSAKGHSQKVFTLDMKNVTVDEVLTHLQKVSDYRFFYNHGQIQKLEKVSITVKNETLENILRRVLKDRFVYKIMEDKLVVISPNKEASDHKVEGVVTDEEGKPVSGVSIQVKGSARGTFTDAEGKFSLDVPDNATIIVSAVGYHSQEIAVGTKTQISIQLKIATSGMNEVVVVAYGKQRRANLTGAIASVNGKELQRTPAISLTNTITGLLPGVVTKNVSGEPGRDDATVLIRGRNTTGNNNPLIVVDGIPDVSGWQRINPNEIESISVLKDASAAIYGAQAANGVILITTKRGVTGKPTISYNFNQGINQPTRIPKMGNSASLAGYFNELLVRQGQPPRYTDEEVRKFADGSDPVNYPNVNWFEEVMKDYSLQSQHNLSVRGGSRDVKYLLSGSYANQNSIFKNGSHSFKIYTIRSNLDAQVNNHIKVNLDLNGGIDDGNYPAFSTKQTFQALNNNLPFMPVYWPNGLPSAGVERGENPIMMASSASGNYNRTVQRFLLKAGFDISIPWVTGLGVDGFFNYRNVTALEKNWQTPWTVYNFDKSTNEYIPVNGGGIVNPQLEQALSNDRNILLNMRIRYDKRLAGHNLNTFIAAEQSWGVGMDFSAFRRDFISTELDELFAGSLVNQVADGRSSESGRQNFFGRLHYDFREKYLLDFNFRYDGSSNFPRGRRYGFFPGLSVGWRISGENFINDRYHFINNLKLRASIGQMGNDRIAAFQFLRLYSLASNRGYNFGFPPIQSLGLTAGVMPNPNITWEVATSKNIGLDGTFWSGLLGFTFDVFQQRRSNILATRSLAIPAYTGLALPDENIGIVENKGFEAELSHAKNFRSLSYRIAGNMAYAKNKVIDISEASNVPPWQKAEGHSIGSDRYYISTGIIRTKDELNNIPVYTGTKVGDLKYKDVNGDGVISAADMVRLDQTSTPQITYGVNLSMSYKAVSLFANFAGAAKVWQPFRFQALLGYNVLQDLLDNRYQEGSMDSKYPTLPQQSGVNSLQSTFWLYNTSFLRLKTLELGYDLPPSLLSKASIKAARVYVNGSNLLTFSKMKLFDPETNDRDGFFYPQSKIYNLGLNITF